MGGSGTANREPPMASQFAILGGSISGGPLTIRRGGLWRSVLAGCISGASVSLMDEIHGTPVSGREEPFACVLLGQRSRQGPFAFLRSSLHADCSSARADPGRLPNCDCCALHAARCKAADGRVAAASPTHQPGGAPEPCCVALPALSARPTLSAFRMREEPLKGEREGRDCLSKRERARDADGKARPGSQGKTFQRPGKGSLPRSCDPPDGAFRADGWSRVSMVVGTAHRQSTPTHGCRMGWLGLASAHFISCR